MNQYGLSHWWGPVFDAERITRSRRWEGYALRSLFVLGLLGGLSLVWLQQANRPGEVTVQQRAAAGMAGFVILTMLELTAVLLVAPAATAGAICLDKSRGALAHVFVTDLTNREIILGKLAARLLPVMGLLACALPVEALATLLGGVDPVAVLGVFLIVAGLAGLALATWIKRTGQATGWTITLFVAGVIGWPIIGIMLPIYQWVDRQKSQSIYLPLLELGLVMGSPIVNTCAPYLNASRKQSGAEVYQQAALILVVAWAVIYFLAALILFEATVWTFDRCLGRASERPGTPRLEPPPASQRRRAARQRRTLRTTEPAR